MIAFLPAMIALLTVGVIVLVDAVIRPEVVDRLAVARRRQRQQQARRAVRR